LSVKFRLSRYGKKKKPFYRIVVADSRYACDGRFIENVGTYNPLTDPASVTIDKEKIMAWYEKGAKPTKTVHSIFKKEGILKEVTQ
jgi:small subunit ribosomal protein S16